jgi:hypothetical protein
MERLARPRLDAIRAAWRRAKAEKDGEKIDPKIDAAMKRLTDNYLILECHMVSVFPDMSIAYDVVGKLPGLHMEIRSERCNHCDNPPCVYCCPCGASHIHERGASCSSIRTSAAAARRASRPARMTQGLSTPRATRTVHILHPPPRRRLERTQMRRILPYTSTTIRRRGRS